MSRCFMLIGVPTAGKSSWCKENPQIERISSDEIRKEWGILGTSEEDKSKNALVFEEVLKRAKKAVKENKDFVIDATNINSKRRINFLKQFNCEKIGVVFATPIEECLKRNSKRERKVPEKVINRMYRNFQPPHYSEGFDKILVYSNGEKNGLEKLMAKNLDCEHDNPNHSSNCGLHCIKTEMNLVSAYGVALKGKKMAKELKILTAAARYHDISKFKVKTFTNFKGEKTKEAHFFNHSNVSAYDWLCYAPEDFHTDEKIEVANLISNHMVFFNKDIAPILKIEERYGKKFMSMLNLLHKADISAH